MNSLISVIVPSYNGEYFIGKCLDSVCSQTYKNLEIIVVDDGSKDRTEEIVKKYISTDPRIRLIKHAGNKGLFQSRITGVKAATGDYVTFIDCDDYLSLDYIRTLYTVAKKNNSELVIGDIVETYDGKAFYYNLTPNRLYNFAVSGRKGEAASVFLKQKYSSYEYHCIAGKLFARKLWQRCLSQLEDYSVNHPKVVMWEDLIFSTVLWKNAFSAANNEHHNVYYFYVKHSGASTMTVKKDDTQKERHLTSCFDALSFFMNEYADTNLIEERDGFYDSACRTIAMDLSPCDSQRIKNLYKTLTKKDLDEQVRKNRPKFPTARTMVDNSFYKKESIIKAISGNEINVVSFDVFDTLVTRSVIAPSDVFSLLSNELNHKFGFCAIDFARIRIESEAVARESLVSSITEDITLDQIYSVISDKAGLSCDVLGWAKAKEIELEMCVCNQRVGVKQLYDIAVAQGKKIIVCSDMYLPKDVICRMLEKSGYAISEEDVYVSSEIKKSKATANLYKYVQRKLGCSSSEFVHIGDTYESDYNQAIKAGWLAFCVPRVSDCLFGCGVDKYSSDTVRRIVYNPVTNVDTRVYQRKIQLRLALGLSAGKIFGEFGETFNPESDFGISPTAVGYGCLGPHLLAVCQWIHKIVIDNDIPQIAFVARDGYLVKESYRLLYPDSPLEITYIRVSRKAVLLADVSSKEDLFSLFTKLNVLNGFTPLSLLDCLMPVIPASKTKAEVISYLQSNGFNPSSPFKRVIEFVNCLHIIADKFVDLSMLDDYKSTLRSYFKVVKPGAYIFDIGYNGRIESALTKLLGYNVGSLYIHVNGDLAGIRNSMLGNKMFTFYDYKPMFTGTIRELLFSEIAPSVDRFKNENGKIVPVFADRASDFVNDLIVSAIQKSSLTFIADYRKATSTLQIPVANGEELSAFYEYFMHYSKPADRKIFMNFVFEDAIGMGEINVIGEWNRNVPSTNIVVVDNHPSLNFIGGEEIYMDGYIVSMIRLINRLFPKGSMKRERMKKLAAFFFHRGGGEDNYLQFPSESSFNWLCA